VENPSQGVNGPKRWAETGKASAAERPNRHATKSYWLRGEFGVRGTRRAPSELPIAIGMDKTGVASIQHTLKFLNRLGDYAARLVGLELALQLNENFIGAC
jgi:hypothetical protein